MQTMTEAIDYFSKGHPLTRLRSHHAWKARQAMLDKFLDVFQPTARTRVLDLGVTPDTTLPESNHFEQAYPWPQSLTAASIEDVAGLRDRFPSVNFVQIPPGPLPFADRSFDLVFCSAVVEHVGSRTQQQEFVRELLRVANGYFITTPNRWFPLEFHTLLPLIHWLPQAQHQRLLRGLGKTFWAQTDNLNLLDAHTLGSLADGAPGTWHHHLEVVRLMGWPSNLMAWGQRR
ncbi:methyltransferase domain-containing protein [Aquabacterium lacunae]|uniref:Methyltransferase domain-containing protein n=1 Tax=Aquabacterium lacunae TaxID=2528630 RepID=A0A4Q9H4S7_9BURK|nr:methyltransferase domain-containing protein [Aquabacterium lacunae]TBO31249.1 methyltransferase domain-containing protein [Aquabacterium lacunae]